MGFNFADIKKYFMRVMAEDTKRQLTMEYIKKIKLYMPILKFGAFNRFDVKDDQFVSISRFSQFFSIIAMIIVTITGYSLIYETSIKNDYIILPEYITVIELGVLNNVVLLNIHFFNRHSGAELFKHCIDIDMFLGVNQTKFMRDIATKDIMIWAIFILSFELVLTVVLLLTFKLPFYIYITGFIYFQMLFSLCYDQVIHVVLYKFMCLRVHYLNVGLVKIANLKTEYLMNQLLSYPFLWKKEYNDCVELPKENTKYVTETLGMIIDQVRRIQHSYRFMIFGCMTSLVIGTFLAVQAVIVFIKNPELTLIRTFSLTGWFVVSWCIFIGITQQTDKLSVQIRRTKLICTYIQLKPNSSDELFHLSRNILDTLGVNDYRVSVYDLFYFNQSILRSIATSVFVFITMQLQIAFPKSSNTNKINA